MKMRTSEINRKTAETDIRLTLNIDGRGDSAVDTGIGFLDHMLTLLARHGRFDLTLTCAGDTHVDGHHTAEDVGLCLGSALQSALGDMKGIVRYGDIALPMDEALVLCAVDISGRSHLTYEVGLPAGKVGTMDTELVEEFLQAFVRRAGITLHLHQLAGSNTHHIVEACFKALSRALRQAVTIEEAYKDEIPSTKGVL
jgi:imidazoleglycerol-phosphate dehydratase